MTTTKHQLHGLVLTRRPGESIKIGQDIWVGVVRAQGGEVRLQIEAPREVVIVREELLSRESRV